MPGAGELLRRPARPRPPRRGSGTVSRAGARGSGGCPAGQCGPGRSVREGSRKTAPPSRLPWGTAVTGASRVPRGLRARGTHAPGCCPSSPFSPGRNTPPPRPHLAVPRNTLPFRGVRTVACFPLWETRRVDRFPQCQAWRPPSEAAGAPGRSGPRGLALLAGLTRRAARRRPSLRLHPSRTEGRACLSGACGGAPTQPSRPVCGRLVRSWGWPSPAAPPAPESRGRGPGRASPCPFPWWRPLQGPRVTALCRCVCTDASLPERDGTWGSACACSVPVRHSSTVGGLLPRGSGAPGDPARRAGSAVSESGLPLVFQSTLLGLSWMPTRSSSPCRGPSSWDGSSSQNIIAEN